MAKFRKILIGGVVGAVAFALSRREVRKMLMGAGRKALPAAPESAGPSGYAPDRPATAPPPTAAPEAPTAAPVDLDTMIAQTQAKVEEHVESFGAPTAAEMATETSAPVEEAPVATEETPAEEVSEVSASAADEALAQEAAWLENPPAAEPVVEEPAPPVVPPQLLQESPFLEEPMVAPVEKPEAAAPMAEPTAEVPAAEAPVDLLGPAPARGAGLSDWESLQFPAAGEPTIETQPEIAEPPAAAVEPPVATPEPPAAEAGTPGPAGIDREEMRRRIDETRSRLKAKAFDAMVSGETFIDENEAEKAEPHGEAGSGLEADVEKSIDDSLREAD